MDARFEIIDAFVDGERVDPEELKDALSEPQGRTYFVDAWLLRNTLQDDTALEDPVAVLPPLPRSPSRRFSWVAAAAVAGVCLAGGYLAGAWMSTPPRPALSTTAAPAATVEATPVKTSFPVPAPTRVIRLEMGADWKESAGGG